jgi:hypothetical protein
MRMNLRTVVGLTRNPGCSVFHAYANGGSLQDGGGGVRVLTEKGYAVRQLPVGSAVTDCPVTSTYTANWRWDLGLYMAFADIKVFSKGQQTGQAVYDAMGGGANMNKFIRGEAKITELVDQLFPGRASVAL